MNRSVLNIPILCVALSVLGSACSAEETESKESVVYGSDDRTDVYAHSSALLRARASQSTVALMNTSDYSVSSSGAVRFTGASLGSSRSLCSGQRFASDPTSAWCSGTLIDDDLVLTAGHCVRNASACSSVRFVFKYYRDAAGSMEDVTTDDIFRCSEIVARRETSSLDYAVIRLDRSASPRFTPAPVKAGDSAISAGAQVTVIGSGSGIPFKIDDGGRVRDARASSLDYFVANTDTFGGNSGSGVYNSAGEVVGILVRGDTDYSYQSGCYVVNTCSSSGCRGEDITYVARAVEAYCDEDSDGALCAGGSSGGSSGGGSTGSVDASAGFSFSATNTNSAQQNTTNGTLSLNAGDQVLLGTCGVSGAELSGDSYLRLYVGASQVAYNDDACGGRGSQISYTASGAETLSIHAGCYSSNSCSGRVGVQITRAEDSGTDPEPNPGGPVDASAGYAFQATNTNSARQNTVNGVITLAAGDQLVLGSCGVNNAEVDGDSYLRLRFDGAQVAYNDDACGGRGSQISYTAAQAGQYTIWAGCYSSNTCSGFVGVQITRAGGGDDGSADAGSGGGVDAGSGGVDAGDGDSEEGEYRLRIVAGNITSGNGQSYDPGHGIRIFQGLQPDIALIQEFNYKSESAADLREFTDTAFGEEFSYTRGNIGNIPNGIVSRYPIRSSGIWIDSQVSNRNFAWAQIDIPGPTDLWAVSVHLLTRNSSVRASEARALLGFIQDNVPSGDFVVIGGDFNTNSYSESALSTLSPVIDIDHRPVDQNGRQGTNASRSKPYDHVLAGNRLDDYHATVRIGSSSYPEGLVFDSRVYTPLSEVSPVRSSDSGSSNMQHMAVVKDFILPGSVDGGSNPGGSGGSGSGDAATEGFFGFSVSNTNNAQQNTEDRSITVQAGQTIQFGTCSLDGAEVTSGDSYIRLIGPDGGVAAYNDDACNRDSYLSYEASAAGSYTMRVGCYSSGSCAGTAAYRVD